MARINIRLGWRGGDGGRKRERNWRASGSSCHRAIANGVQDENSPKCDKLWFLRREINPCPLRSGEHIVRVREGIIAGTDTHVDIVFSELCALCKWHGAFAHDYQCSSRRTWFRMKAILIVSSFKKTL